jgi:pantothenate kinase-related protein Tda10
MIWFIGVNPQRKSLKSIKFNKIVKNSKISSFSRWDSKEIIDIVNVY